MDVHEFCIGAVSIVSIVAIVTSSLLARFCIARAEPIPREKDL